MAYAVRPVFCQLSSKNPAVQRAEPPVPVPVQKQRVSDSSALSTESGKIVLQPRLCTLRSYGGDRLEMVKTKGGDEVSPFFATLSEYIESSRKSQDFETISGRLAMVI